MACGPAIAGPSAGPLFPPFWENSNPCAIDPAVVAGRGLEFCSSAALASGLAPWAGEILALVAPPARPVTEKAGMPDAAAVWLWVAAALPIRRESIGMLHG
jgi:hypothetical protein